jgi:hypothetical protein
MAKKRLERIIINPLINKVLSLLQRNSDPAVTIRRSLTRNAGYGVFTTRPVRKGEVTHTRGNCSKMFQLGNRLRNCMFCHFLCKLQAVCLYPGVFSAGASRYYPFILNDVRPLSVCKMLISDSCICAEHNE